MEAKLKPNFIALSLLAAPCFALVSVSAFGQTADGAGSNRDEGAVAVAESVLAQSVEVVRSDDDDPDSSDDYEEVIVTGSRIKRSTYTSISPLQIITAEVKREAGLVDAAQIVQENSVSSGLQWDLTHTNWVNKDGPVASTANLRGLGGTRTLVLLNGRRLAPTGSEGAPVSPNLRIVPGLLIKQYDTLLDGASSIYGSDAVAGVLNAIMHKDFNGLTVRVAPTFPMHDGGDVQTLGVSWGRNWDRGFIGMGMQHYDSGPVTRDQRPWTAGCSRLVEVDENGRIRHIDLRLKSIWRMREDKCSHRPNFNQRIEVPWAGSLYYTPGYSNGGWPNFSESHYGSVVGIDANGDGKIDVDWNDYNVNKLNGPRQQAHLFAPYRSTSGMAYGEYTLEGEMNLTPYFEMIYGTDKSSIYEGPLYSLNPRVPALNPYNICNPQGAGVDCARALGVLFEYLGWSTSWVSRLLGPRSTRVTVGVRGDRDTINVKSSWVRAVVGLRGDMPFLNVGSLSDWGFDVSVTHSSSRGQSHRFGVRADRLELALGYYSNDWKPCENNINEATRVGRTDSQGRPLRPLTSANAAPGCVPVNMFASSLFAKTIGDFGTQEERDYLMDNRNFDTRYMQTLFSAFATGELFRLPAGAVLGNVGIEYRVDEIKSIPDEVARDGLIFGYFKDGGAEGSKYTREFYAEIELPLLANKPGATEITTNLSTRFTEDEYYGSNWTGAVKVGWRPINSLLVRGTYGTSFRAPNLREVFLRDQTKFPSVTDPCYVPNGALRSIPGTTEREYIAALDKREAHVLQRCREQGIDPTMAGGGASNYYSVESSQFGALEHAEELSNSTSIGVVWEQPFTEAFGFTTSVTYYHINIDDALVELSPTNIIWECYQSRQDRPSRFCDRITRNSDMRISFIKSGFINRDQERVRGVDMNITADTTLSIFERPIDVSLELSGHRLIERSTLLIQNGQRTRRRYSGNWYYNKYKGEMALRMKYDRWRLTWSSRYLGPYPGDRSLNFGYDARTSLASTCLGPPLDVRCKDVDTASEYWLHHVSLGYKTDTWELLGGVRNVFDKSPPEVDFWVSGAINNTPRGSGYDLSGRAYFLSATYRFGSDDT